MRITKLVVACLAATLLMTAPGNAQSNASPGALRRLAEDYYGWRNQQYPVFASDAGLHTWDSKLTDYSPAALAARRAHVVRLLAQVNSMRTSRWSKDDQIDWLLFRAQLESPVFFD